MKSAIVLILSILALLAIRSQDAPAAAAAPDGGTKYSCPMKCEGDKTYDAPGKCPVCGMALREVESSAAARPAKRAGDADVRIAGAMMNVMHNGELAGTIALDTIAPRAHLYGLGPVEYLTGEILVMDGTSYVSTVSSPAAMTVAERYDVQAPFFVYAHVDRWKEVPVPGSVTSVARLEAFLNSVSKDDPRPFAFKASGTVKRAEIHVVNLPKGSTVASPEDAHRGEQKYTLRQREVDLVGFFSREHKGVFTHHDSFVHIHLLTADKKMMGHLDDAEFVKGKIRVFLPE